MEQDELLAIEELKLMSPEELERVMCDTVRWQCKVKFCKCYTRLKDYGIYPVYYTKRGIKSTDGKEVIHWVNTRERFLLCSKHWKRYKNKDIDDIPLKRSKSGGIIWGYDDTGKELIIF